MTWMKNVATLVSVHSTMNEDVGPRHVVENIKTAENRGQRYFGFEEGQLFVSIAWAGI